MKSESHRRALIATAKVACAAAVFGGCATQARSSSDYGQQPAVTQVPLPAGATQPLVQTAAASCTPQQPDTLDSCWARVETATAKNSTADEPILGCCQRIAENHDAENKMWEGQERHYCCSALDWRGSMACTPWGPPVPPSQQWGWV